VRRASDKVKVTVDRIVKGKLAVVIVDDGESALPYYIEVKEEDTEETLKQRALQMYELKKRFPQLA